MIGWKIIISVVCISTVPKDEQTSCKENWCGVVYMYYFNDNYKGKKNDLVLKIQQYS